MVAVRVGLGRAGHAGQLGDGAGGAVRDGTADDDGLADAPADGTRPGLRQRGEGGRREGLVAGLDVEHVVALQVQIARDRILAEVRLGDLLAGERRRWSP